MSRLSELIGASIGELLNSAKGVITTFVKDKGLEQQINAELDRQAHELKLRQLDITQQAIEAEVADRADARAMNKELIKSNDVFVRRFPMFFAIGVIAMVAIMICTMLFVEIPNSNRDILNFSIGSVLGYLGTIATFYFGSSYDGKHKQNINQ